MFSGKYSLSPDSDSGSYFIDRDPVVFRHILNYLRGDLGVHMEYLSVYELAVLRADAVYYGLEGLSEMVTEKEVEMERKRERRKSGEAIDRYTWDSKNCPGHFVISNGGKRVSSTNSTAGLITTNVRIRPKKVTEIKIHILKEPNWTYLGVATKSCLTSGVHPQTHPAGWFFKSHHSANFIELYHDGVKLAEVVGYNFGEGEIIKLRVNEHMALSIATDGKPEVHSYPLSRVDGLYFALAMAYRGHELEITDKGS
uniref:Potassium channel tetramerisation-type BTB domain-containing protein n=1 Tax=Arcella intermedia TaxID=1963864 RepID=A0A6B2LD76_9EUKA